MKKLSKITMYATIKNYIWLPPVECWKEVKKVFTPNDLPFTRQWTGLEDALDHLTNEGDFQGGMGYITDLYMEVEYIEGNKRIVINCNINPKAKILQDYLHQKVKDIGEFTYQDCELA